MPQSLAKILVLDQRPPPYPEGIEINQPGVARNDPGPPAPARAINILLTFLTRC